MGRTEASPGINFSNQRFQQVRTLIDEMIQLGHNNRINVSDGIFKQVNTPVNATITYQISIHFCQFFTRTLYGKFKKIVLERLI